MILIFAFFVAFFAPAQHCGALGESVRPSGAGRVRETFGFAEASSACFDTYSPENFDVFREDVLLRDALRTRRRRERGVTILAGMGRTSECTDRRKSLTGI